MTTQQKSRRQGRRDVPLDLGVLAAVDDALADPHPLPMLRLASRTVFALHPRWPEPQGQWGHRPFPTLPAFLEVLAASGRQQHVALAWVLAHLTLDEVPRRRLLRAVDPAGLPAWMPALDDVEVHAAWQSLHVLRDSGTLALGARLGGFELTAVARLGADLGVVRDGFALAESLRTFRRREAPLLGAQEWETAELSPADARVQLEAGLIEVGYAMPTEPDGWPSLRPLVTWLTGRCPPGGQGLPRPVWTEGDGEAILSEFFGRIEGRPFADDPGAAALLRYWLDVHHQQGFGDPLVVSSRRLENFLFGWVLERPPLGDVRLGRLPALLGAFVSVAHERRAISPSLTAKVLAALHELTPRYLERVAPPWRGYRYEQDDRPDPAEVARQRLADEVGGEDQLAALEAEPLPVEPLDLTKVPEDLHDRLRTVEALCAEACRSLLDEEALTAVRRLAVDIAVARPAALHRRAKDETTAAALCWLVAHHNDLLGPGKRIQNRDLIAHFAASGMTGRAHTLRSELARANGFFWPQTLGSARYLLGSYRAQLIARRDAPSPAGLSAACRTRGWR